jgi:phage terminase large subunit
MNLEINTTKTYEHQNNSTARVTIHYGGTRSGKTYALLQWCIVQALTDKETITIVRKTIPSLKRTVMKDFKDIMVGLGIWDENSFNQTDRVYEFYNGSVLQFVSTDDAEKLRGLKSSILWLEEANEIDSESYFQLQIRTTKKVILSLNPTVSPYHWIRGIEGASTHFTTYRDNTFLERSVVRAIEELKQTNPKAWKIYGMGEFTTNERAVFNFNVVEWMPDDAEFLCWGFDIGYAADPCALVAIYKWGAKDIYLIESLYEKGMVTDDIIKHLKTCVNGREEIWCDSSEPRLIEELYRAGFNAKPVIKGKDSINFGIQVMQNYNINIPKSCSNLVNEFYSYQWAVDKHQHVTDKPEGGLDHLIDAARYGCMMKLSNKATAAGKYIISVR